MKRELPHWAPAVICGLLVVILGFIGWRYTSKGEADPGPPMKVHPGMYDLRAEGARHKEGNSNK